MRGFASIRFSCKHLATIRAIFSFRHLLRVEKERRFVVDLPRCTTPPYCTPPAMDGMAESHLGADASPWSPNNVTRVLAVSQQSKDLTATPVSCDTGASFWIQVHACFPELQTCVLNEGKDVDFATNAGAKFIKFKHPKTTSLWMQQFDYTPGSFMVMPLRRAKASRRIVATGFFTCDGSRCGRYVRIELN